MIIRGRERASMQMTCVCFALKAEHFSSCVKSGRAALVATILQRALISRHNLTSLLSLLLNKTQTEAATAEFFAPL